MTELFTNQFTRGLDGEVTLGADPTAPLLCSLTSGAMGRFKGVNEVADLHWWLFDYITEETIKLPYYERYDRLTYHLGVIGDSRLHLVPYDIIRTPEELVAVNARYLDAGYEGTIIRNPNALYKEGRATQKGQELWRIKPWADFEILVTGVTEGERNENEAKTNSLGRTERSSAKAGKVPNGQVGSVQGTLLADVYSPVTGKKLFDKGLPITAGSGKMSVKQATEWFTDQSQIVGHIAKIKFMSHGCKDLPRMATFESKRLPQDMS